MNIKYNYNNITIVYATAIQPQYHFHQYQRFGLFSQRGALINKEKVGKRAIDRIITAFELGRKVLQVRDYRSNQGQLRGASK